MPIKNTHMHTHTRAHTHIHTHSQTYTISWTLYERRRDRKKKYTSSSRPSPPSAQVRASGEDDSGYPSKFKRWWWCRKRALALKSQVRHDQAWSPHGWLTVSVTCPAVFGTSFRITMLHSLQEFFEVKFCPDYKSASDETINWGLPCVYMYACKNITYIR